MVTDNNEKLIMAVEDSPEDYEALLRALKKAGVTNPVVRFERGDDAIDYLCRRGCYDEEECAPRPAIMLLDLNLPGMDGREVLHRIKSDPVLRMLPVVVFTTSGEDKDVLGCYAEGANSYIQKPLRMDDLVSVVKELSGFWLNAAQLPRWPVGER